MIELNIVPYKHKYLEHVRTLHDSQGYVGVDAITTQTLPKIGFVVLMGDQPIATGFLRRLEPCYAQFDTFATNAHFGSAIRHQAINMVVDALTEEAKRLKLHGIMANTLDAGIISRAQASGFHIVPQTILAKPL